MDFKNVLKLSDGYKYIIANQINLEGKTYYQMLRVDSESYFFIAERENDEIIHIDDEKNYSKGNSRDCKILLGQ